MTPSASDTFFLYLSALNSDIIVPDTTRNHCVDNGSMEPQNLNRPYTTVMAASAALFTFVMIIYAGRGWEQNVRWWGGAGLLAAWAILPYLGIVGFSRTSNENKKQRRTRLIGFTLIVAFGIFILIDGFFIHSDAQNALLFVFLPIYQWAGIIIVVAIRSFL